MFRLTGWRPPGDATLATSALWLVLDDTPHLEALLGVRAVVSLAGRARADGVFGWGAKANSQKARAASVRRALPFWFAEDGFLRSVGLGRDGVPAVSLILDDRAPHYDARTPSRLEMLLGAASPDDGGGTALAARIAAERLTKYNHLPDRCPAGLEHADGLIVLVDQVAGDLSVQGSGGNDAVFAAMLAMALETVPRSRIVVRGHPDVMAGHRRSSLVETALKASVKVVADGVNPHAILDRTAELWTLSSQLGFDALLRGTVVRCFGAPFYAGWGLTHDTPLTKIAEAAIARRAAIRQPPTLAGLSRTTLVDYARYADPVRGTSCDVHAAIDRLVWWRRQHLRLPNRAVVIGASNWKRPMLAAYFGAAGRTVQFCKREPPDSSTRTRIVWGPQTIADGSSPVLRVEDGFLRSHGLGASFAFARSLTIDASGLHYDASRASDLEQHLATATFTEADLERARRLRTAIIASGVSKYNLGGSVPEITHLAQARPVLLVIGQVPGDASLWFGPRAVEGNESLLRAARAARPDAFIVYREHPDVVAGLRPGRLDRRVTDALADLVSLDGDIIGWIDRADEVHVVTSLAGFEALLRETPVTCWGAPFYAGWGLTDDRIAINRRVRRLSVDQLVAGALIDYPVYCDPRVGLACGPEDVVFKLGQDPPVPPGALGWLHDKTRQTTKRVVRRIWRSLAR